MENKKLKLNDEFMDLSIYLSVCLPVYFHEMGNNDLKVLAMNDTGGKSNL